MSYLVLARKWRPKQFASVVAQDHVTTTLENAVKQNRIASAYLFTGPRGVGKTTMARLLAKAVNCESGPTVTPCDQCTSCVEIAGSNSMDVIEIDGASNRGIDEVRSIRDNARFAPAGSLKKIYIIDEVHMLTEQAFNALLKTLEEPPAHILFIFATTEVHKVPNTILSRCQRFDFRRVPLDDIVGQLRKICQAEAVKTDDEALYLIAKRAEGSMRDSQSLLDQAISFCGDQIDKKEVAKLFGLIEQDLFFECTDCIVNSDAQGAIMLCEKIHNSGVHLGEFFEQLSEHLSALLTVRVTGSQSHLAGLENYMARYQETAAKTNEIELLKYLQIITDAQTRLAKAANPRVLLETSLLKIIHLAGLKDSPNVSEPGGHSAQPNTADGKRSSDTVPKTANGDRTAQSQGVAMIPEYGAHASISATQKQEVAHQSVGGLFSAELMSKVQGIPIVRTKEASTPLKTVISDEISALKKIQQSWTTILERVKTKKISLGSFLELGIPTTIKEGTLEVCFGEGNDFHIKSVNNQKTVIQQIIQAETGFSVRLHCRKDITAFERVKEQVEGADNSHDEQMPVPKVVHNIEDKDQMLDKLFESYPVVKRFVEAVDGELIRCQPSR